MNLIKAGLILVLLFSCVKKSKIEIPAEDPKIVVNSVISPDEYFWVNLSFSVGNSLSDVDFEKLIIEDATVSIYENGIFIEQLPYIKNGFYVSSNFKPQAENHYRIEVELEDYDLVWAETTMPNAPIIYFTQIEPEVYVSPYYDTVHKLEFSMYNNLDKKTYCEIDIDGNIHNSNLDYEFHYAVSYGGIFFINNESFLTDSVYAYIDFSTYSIKNIWHLI